MSEFGKPKGCMNGCGGMVYFDAHSSAGHPTADKWIPLEYKGGMKTDTAHKCPKRGHNGSSQLMIGNVASATTATTTMVDNLAVIKQIAAALNEYISMKEANVQ